MKVDHRVEPRRPELSAERQVVSEPSQAARSAGDDDLVDVGVGRQDRRRQGLDENREAEARDATGQGPNRRRDEDNVTDKAKANEEDLQSSRQLSVVTLQSKTVPLSPY